MGLCIYVHMCVHMFVYVQVLMLVYKPEVNHGCFSSGAICLGFIQVLTGLELAKETG